MIERAVCRYDLESVSQLIQLKGGHRRQDEQHYWSEEGVGGS